MSTTIHLDIDRLVLDGPLPPGQLPVLLAALRSELTLLLTDTPPTSSSATDRVRARDLSPGTASDPTTLGRELARSLAHSLSQNLGGDP
jgi:hypothetical protein